MNNLDIFYAEDYVDTHLFSCSASYDLINRTTRVEVTKADNKLFHLYVNYPASLLGFHHKVTRAEYEYCVSCISRVIGQTVQQIKSYFIYG